MLKGSSLKAAMFCTLLLALAACGPEKKGKSGGGRPAGKVEILFKNAALKHNIPVRMLLAIAFKESKLSTKPESAVYADREKPLHISLTETAFGIPYHKLGLPADETSQDLAVQLDAYGAWINSRLAEKQINRNPTTPEEKFYWIWEMSLLHREGQDARRNVQVLFALELIEKLNQGDIWQDTESGEIVELPKELSPIYVEDLPDHMRASLKMFKEETNLAAAEEFELPYPPPTEEPNSPNHIRVIHCPLSLSACLELQSQTDDSEAPRLNAHYVIPNDRSLVPKALRIAQTKTAVLITNKHGEPELINDAVVIMLVGDSGRYIEGKRAEANPKWFTGYQLERMGSLIRGICTLLSKEGADINTCQTPGVPGGVQFVHQGSSEAYQWGDIPDYDESIFWTYINTADALSGPVAFTFPANQKIFDANGPIQFHLSFFPGTERVVLETLERCPDNKLIWSTIQRYDVRHIDRKVFETNLFHRGPNGNGHQFFRALAYNGNGSLMGWAIEDVFTYNYDTAPGPGADTKSCQRNGT